MSTKMYADLIRKCNRLAADDRCVDEVGNLVLRYGLVDVLNALGIDLRKHCYNLTSEGDNDGDDDRADDCATALRHVVDCCSMIQHDCWSF